jgi:nucleolar protein 15
VFDERQLTIASRVPVGFHEHQMRQYFSQFGTVTRLRLCRNKKTGQSKQFGFIEFDNVEVADIVQRAMHNYLLFGHILQVKMIPAESVHPDLFKGANKRFKKVPWGNIHARALKTPATRETWEKRVEREEERRRKKQEALKEYDYEFEIPKVKQVKQLPSRAARLEAKEELALEAPLQVDKKVKDVEEKQTGTEVIEPETTSKADGESIKAGKKATKKSKKSKKT